jgi:hypothetical protein
MLLDTVADTRKEREVESVLERWREREGGREEGIGG